MSSQLELHRVCVNHGAFEAVKDVSLSLEQGQIGCLLGPSGCGKTTLLRAIAGFQPLAAGTIILKGQTLSSASHSTPPEQRRVGMVFQDFALFPHLNVERNIGFGLGSLNANARAKRVAEMIDLVGLGPWTKAFPHELSGGQQQRVALARALAPNPEVLLLDEPFSSLDSELREQLATEVGQLLKENNVTSILVTHDQHEAFAMADRIALMHRGSIVQSDTPYNLYHHPSNEFVAGFIGQGAVINVSVNESGELEGGLGTLDKSHPHWSAGDNLRLLVRPDDLEYSPHSTMTLAITAKSFRGAEYLYELELPGGQRVPCLTPSHIDLKIGASLPVRFNLQDVVVFNGSNGGIKITDPAST